LKDDFFVTCRGKAPQSERYFYRNLLCEPRVLNKSWALYVPEDLRAITKKGVYYAE
jgi:uncharacterized membrane protein